MNEQPLQLVTSGTDAEKAEKLKEKIKEIYINHLLPALDEAAKDGFIINAGVGMGQFGKFVIQQLDVMKKF